MNINTAAAIIDDNITTIKVEFTTSSSYQKSLYTFKCPITLAATLKVDDKVIVDTVNGLQIAVVKVIDEESDMQPDADYDYKWAFQKVDLEVLETLKHSEEAVLKKLKAHRRNALKAGILAMMASQQLE